eukprot:1159930-Rhodomonas_salina.2
MMQSLVRTCVLSLHGTDMGCILLYASAMRYPVLTCIVLYFTSAIIPGTDIGCIVLYASAGTDMGCIGLYASAIQYPVLNGLYCAIRQCYAISGTDMVVLCYALAMRCPALTRAMLLPGC